MVLEKKYDKVLLKMLSNTLISIITYGNTTINKVG